MDLAPAFDALADMIRSIPRSELLVITLIALATGWLGSLLVRHRVGGGRLLRTASTFALVGVLLTVVLQLSRFDPRIDIAVPQIGLPEQLVEGGETRIPLAPDGHYWIRAELNGVPANFLVDTGATVTAVNQNIADAAGLTPRRGGIPVRINTANGAINAQLATAQSIAFGNVEASGIDVIIAPNLGSTNVLGMNVLSRLESWQVRDNTLILTPGDDADGDAGGAAS